MLDKNIAQQVLEVAMETGGDFAEIFFEDRFNNSISLRSNITESIVSSRVHGAGIRVYLNTEAFYVYTNDTSLKGLLDCAKKAAAIINESKKHPVAKLQALHKYAAWDIKLKPSQVEAKQKIDMLKRASKVALAVDEISQVNAYYTDAMQSVWIANTDGLFVTETRPYTRTAIVAVASDGKENQTSVVSPGASSGFEFYDTLDLEALSKKAANTAVTMLHAPVCPAGYMPVVIDNAFGGVIFHEACGHSLEATSVAKGFSEFSNKLGQQIASEKVTAIDDGTIPFEWGSTQIDDEGTPTSRLVLIENGILKNYMIDRLNNRIMKMSLTGSARRESYKYPPTSRMRNTYIAAGNDDADEIISTMGNGLYAKSMGGGSVDPATGEFNFNVLEAYLVKDGKIAHPVRGASLIGKGSEILTKIDMVSKDMKMAQGMCGSISGSVPVNVGQALIRVSGLTVGGYAE
ncbi:MAG: TldD/PmbA family protein [Christensenellaceae bacterium]|nr:TldD/PmbA family protein [Christensenellaceae bacterium]